MEPYYLHWLSITPAIMAAHNAKSAANLFSSHCGLELTEDDVHILPTRAIDASAKNTDGALSIPIRDRINKCSTEGVVGTFPIDYSSMCIDQSRTNHDYMFALNLIMMGVPFTHAKKETRALRSDDGFHKLRRWLEENFGIYVFEVKDLKNVHGHASTLQEMNALKAEKMEALKSAVTKVNLEFEGREKELRSIIKL